MLIDVPYFIKDLFAFIGIPPNEFVLNDSMNLRESLKQMFLAFSAGVGGNLIASAITAHSGISPSTKE